MWRFVYAAAALVFLGSLLAAQDTSKAEAEITAKLAQEKVLFAESLSVAKKALLRDFDAKHAEVKGNKTLKLETLIKQLDELEAEKKALQEKDTLPGSTLMKAALADYRTARTKAEGKMKVAFETAINSYRDLGDVRTAAKLLAEMKEHLAKPKSFIPLFNGKDLAGWTVESGDPKQWSVEGEAIVANSPKPEAKINDNYMSPACCLTQKCYRGLELLFPRLCIFLSTIAFAFHSNGIAATQRQPCHEPETDALHSFLLHS